MTAPAFADRWLTVYAGDCREVLTMLEPSSMDAVVTDPPYELGFMGRSWDRSGVAFQPETWAAMLRLAKPGAWLVAFAGTRTQHRIGVAIEDAGWELRDTLIWIFAQGMPKGRTTLKPAHEPIILARKPAARVTALQIEETRIPFAGAADESESKTKNQHAAFGTEPGGNHVYGDYSMVPRRDYDPEMSHLVRLITPPGGVLLDPFIGSGTTAVAAAAAGRRTVGIELDESYLRLIPGRMRLLSSEVTT